MPAGACDAPSPPHMSEMATTPTGEVRQKTTVAKTIAAT
jgi:hypothetical protein